MDTAIDIFEGGGVTPPHWAGRRTLPKFECAKNRFLGLIYNFWVFSDNRFLELGQNLD